MKKRAKQHTLKARATVLEAVVSHGEGNERIQGKCKELCRVAD